MAFLYQSGGQAFLVEQGISTRLLSDAATSFFFGLKQKYQRLKGTKAEKTALIKKEMLAFIAHDQGLVSLQSLKAFSVKEGIPIREAPPTFSGLRLQILKGDRTISEMKIDDKGKFLLERIPSGVYSLKISNPSGNLPAAVTLSINGLNAIVCCCPGPPCDDPIELIVGDAKANRRNSIHLDFAKLSKYDGTLKMLSSK